MKIEINVEYLAHRLAMYKVEKKYQDLNINPYIDNNEEYVGCKFIPLAQEDFDKHKERYIKLILNNRNNDTIQTKKTD